MKTITLIITILFNSMASTSLLAMTSAQKDIVFIAGFDEGDNTYYTNAKKHFSQLNYLVVDDIYDMAEILNWLRLHYDKSVHGNIHIVSHSNPWRGLSLKTTSDGERISEVSLKDALFNESITPLDKTVLRYDAKIIFHSCGLGQNKSLLAVLKSAITQNNDVTIYASEEFNVFGGKYTGHYLARTYYGYYPTAQSPGPRQLAQEFKQKYPNVKTDWESVLKTRTEQLSGDMYTYKFNIPIEWEFEFEDPDDIPEFSSKEDIMDWISEIDELKNAVEAFDIPMEKFRWLSKTNENNLTIKGKTTVMCVMQPLMRTHTTDYIPVDIESEYYVKL